MSSQTVPVSAVLQSGRTIITQLELTEERMLTRQLMILKDALDQKRKRIALKMGMGATVEPGELSPGTIQ